LWAHLRRRCDCQRNKRYQEERWRSTNASHNGDVPGSIAMAMPFEKTNSQVTRMLRVALLDLFHETRRIWNWARSQPPNCGSPWRLAQPDKSAKSQRGGRAALFAALAEQPC